MCIHPRKVRPGLNLRSQKSRILILGEKPISKLFSPPRETITPRSGSLPNEKQIPPR